MRPPVTGGAFVLRPSFVCRSCLAQQRRQAFSATTSRRNANARTAPRDEPPASGITALSSRRLVSVSGPDAAKYLQGVLTSSIYATGGDGNTAPRDRGFYAAFLSAQGRMLHDVFVYPDSLGVGGQHASLGDSFLVEVDAAEAERLQRHIRRYKLRARFDVRLVDSEEATVWHAWDESGLAGLAARTARGRDKDTTIVLEDPRTPTLGFRIVTPRDNLPTVDVEPSTEEVYCVRRYLQGVAEGQDELVREVALPLESNLDVEGAIDFHKGCYVGQELTIRTKHRGVVRKRVLPCLVYGEGQAIPDRLAYRPSVKRGDGPDRFGAEMIPGETSIGRVGKKGRSPGKWLRGVGNIGLGLCRLEIMTDVVLPGETAAGAYNPDDEFVLQDSTDEDHIGQPVRIKAFVPAWLRSGLDEAAQMH